MVHSPLIAKLEMLSPLSAGGREALVGVLRQTIHVRQNRDIVARGARSDHVHVLLEGWAARYEVLKDGSRQITAFLLPGDFCDQQTLLLPALDHSICALTPATVARVSRDRLRALMHEHPELTQALWMTSVLDESIARAWLTNIGRRQGLPRIAHLLCELFTRMKMLGLCSDHSIELPVTQGEIGDAQGLTPVHVNRVLQQLRREGYIDLRGRNLHILKPDALARLAGFNPAYLRAPDAADAAVPAEGLLVANLR